MTCRSGPGPPNKAFPDLWLCMPGFHFGSQRAGELSKQFDAIQAKSSFADQLHRRQQAPSQNAHRPGRARSYEYTRLETLWAQSGPAHVVSVSLNPSDSGASSRLATTSTRKLAWLGRRPRGGQTRHPRHRRTGATPCRERAPRRAQPRPRCPQPFDRNGKMLPRKGEGGWAHACWGQPVPCDVCNPAGPPQWVNKARILGI